MKSKSGRKQVIKENVEVKQLKNKHGPVLKDPDQPEKMKKGKK